MGDVYRAPMRARTVEVPAGAGAEFGLRAGVVGIGEPMGAPPASLEEAVAAAAAAHGAKAARMLRGFAELPEGTVVWTRDTAGAYWRGRLAGAWRYDDSAAARAVGIHHVRPASWDERPCLDDDVPAAVAAAFARGGRNLQRIRAAGAA